MVKIKRLSSTIPALETFKRPLENHSRDIFLETDPLYCEIITERFENNIKTGVENIESIKSCTKYLNKKYRDLALLIGSLYEVKRGWDRLSDVFSLIETDPPINKNWQIYDAQWWRFCSDSFWFADYGYCEKIITFLKKLRRSSILDKNSRDMKIVEDSIGTINGLLKTAKDFRNPVAHTQSFFTEDEIIDVFWQMYLAINYKMDFIGNPLNTLDSFYLMDKQIHIKAMDSWIKFNYDKTNKIFTKLNRISLKKLSIR
ncbi:hypothetical protein ACFLWU_06445 [Chloroflexota bacterium]